MQKRTILAKLKDLHAKNGKIGLGWKGLAKAGIDEDDIVDYWDYLSDALDDALGKGWRSGKSTLPKELDDSEDPPPKGHHQFSVYVIELDDAVRNIGRFAKANPNIRKGCVYVGQTWRSPKVRRQQHLDGYKACPLVHRHGGKLNLMLTKEGQFETRDAAKREEKRYAVALRKQGHGVWWH